MLKMVSGDIWPPCAKSSPERTSDVREPARRRSTRACGTAEYHAIMVLYGTSVVKEGNGYDIHVKAPPGRRRRKRGARSHPRCGLCGVCEERLRNNQHA